MPDNNERKPSAANVENNKSSTSGEKKNIRRTSGVVVTGRGLRRVENLPTERAEERLRKKRNEDEE